MDYRMRAMEEFMTAMIHFDQFTRYVEKAHIEVDETKFMRANKLLLEAFEEVAKVQ